MPDGTDLHPDEPNALDGNLGASPVPIAWVTLHAPDIKGRGYWDQGWLEETVAGDGWPTGLAEFEHVDHPREFRGRPGIVVVPARWHVDDAAELADAAPPGSLFMLTGDEEGAFPRRDLPADRVWLQTPWRTRARPADRFFGCGTPPACRPILAAYDGPTRPRGWFYSGQLNNPRRQEAYEVLARRRDRVGGSLRVTKMFGGGYPYEQYLGLMSDARAVPCPSGSFTPDTFRLYETLEAGAVPVVDTGCDRAEPDYWTLLFGEEPPFPILDRWDSFDAVMDEYVDATWPAPANRAGAWWIGQKRKLARWFAADVANLSPSRDRGADGRITVLVPFSPIPSHPRITVLAETMATIRDRLPTAEIIVMVDGVRPEQEHRRADYEEATRRLIWRAQHDPAWRGVLPLVFDDHHHQAAMTRRALDLVTTPHVLFVEQDTPLIGAIPFEGLADALDTGAVNLIRLSHEAAVLEPHRHLMLDDQPMIVGDVPLIRTVQWSQRPHLATTAFYRRIIGEFFGAGARSFIEDVMHGVVDNRWRRHGGAGWSQFRLAIYAPQGGDIKRSGHIDGREDDPKYGQVWTYDGPTPEGAPTPRTTVETPAAPPAAPRRERTYRLGIFGARADRRGLAIQTTEAARHLAPDRVFGVDMKDLSPYTPDWRDYHPDTLTVAAHDEVTHDLVREWLTGLDVVFGCETFYVPWFTSLAASMGVRTVLQPNPEFVGHVLDWQPRPDVLAVPSTWRIGEIPDAVHLPVGVNRARLPFRLRTRADTFLMVVGHQAVHDRQGLRVVLAALRHVTRPVNVVIRSQRPLASPGGYGRHVTLDLRVGDIEDYWQLYDEGDVLLHPRRYGGLSLPMQEALSCGMPVLMPNAPPQDSVLPDGMLLPCTTGQSFRSLVGPLPLYDVSPRVLAARIDELVDDPGEVAILSKQADGIAAGLDWTVLADRYDALFEETVRAGR